MSSLSKTSQQVRTVDSTCAHSTTVLSFDGLFMTRGICMAILVSRSEPGPLLARLLDSSVQLVFHRS
jgi:hypothetical protein